MAPTRGLKSKIARAGMALAGSVMAVLIPQQALASLCDAESDSSIEWVSRVQINSNEIIVPAETDVHDATGSSLVTLSPGSSYPVEVDVVSSGSSLAHQFVSIWLDLNQDGDVADPGELVYSGNKTFKGLSTFASTISVPSTAHNGEMLGRVILRFADPPHLCGDNYYGSTVNFKVSISDGVNPNAPSSGDGLDVETKALVNDQVKTAQQLTDVQITNFRNRLTHLHSESARRGSPLGISINTPIAGLGSSELLGYASMLQSAAEARTAQNSAAGQANALADHDERDGDEPPEVVDYSRPFAIWSDGALTIGSRSDGALDLDYTAVGISFGGDYRFTDKLIAGLGFGLGRQVSDIGSNGTKNKTYAYTGAAYASYEMIDDFFIDGLLGGAALNFDTKRYVSAGDFATGDRTGSQIFGSLTATYEFSNDATRIAPYGGIEFARSWLNGYEETGSSANYRYSDQTLNSLSGVFGIQIERVIQQEWGDMTPGIRFEYAHDFADASQGRVGDAGGASYTDTIETDPDMVDALSLGLSLKNRFYGGLAIDLDYEFTYGGAGNLDHTFGAHVAQSF